MVAGALLDDGEVEADTTALRQQTGGVLLGDSQVLLVGAAGQEPGEGRGMPGGEPAAGPLVGVEVVGFHGVKTGLGAAVDPGTDDVHERPPFRAGGDVEQRLVPVLVDDGLSVPVPQQQLGVAVLPEAGRVGLGLEGVDVADVVETGGRLGRAVAGHGPDSGGRGIGAAELVVEGGVRRRWTHRGRDRCPARRRRRPRAGGVRSAGGGACRAERQDQDEGADGEGA